jgi:hypothetical protein
MDENFKVKHLLADELTYELRIRGITTSRNQDDKRKLLGRALSKELGRPEEYFLSLHDAEYDHDTEVQAIEDTLESIRAILAEFEGTAEDMIFKRLRTLTHLSFRIRRKRLQQDAEYRNEAYATCLLLEADLQEKAAEASPVTVEAPPVVATTPIYVHPHVRSPEPKLVPIHTWGVSFNGEEKGMTVNQFLERVEELSVARNATSRDLFNAAIDLFSGKALIWYSSVRNRLSDWEEVVRFLKEEFLPPDLLWDEIKGRLQGKSESITIYVVVMETLFARLSRPPAEITKVKTIRRNLLPCYLNQLSITEVVTVPELIKLCKKVEELSALRQKHRAAPKSSCVLEPELAYVRASEPAKANPRAIIVKESSGTSVRRSEPAISSARPFKCWHCQQPNHSFVNCRVKRKQFCYRCRFIKTETQFGEQVVVDCSEFKTPLLQRFTEKISEKVIQTLNNLLKQGKNMFMVSEGIVGRTTNIKFVEQTEE